jgi:tetratricopeptide (TPR) repeat protein
MKRHLAKHGSGRIAGRDPRNHFYPEEGRTMAGHLFISYSGADARDFAFKLHDALEAGPPHIPAWLDKRDIPPGQDWDTEIEKAIRDCASLLFVMSLDSVEERSVCKHEWSRALRYKKPVIPLLCHRGAVPPFRLESRQHVDFTVPFDQALARLRNHLSWLESPAGMLQALEDRLADANRDLRRAGSPEQEARVRDDIIQFEAKIEAERRRVADPEGAKKRTEEGIARGIERERQSSQPVEGISRTRFLNQPPAVAPSYFQNRYVESRLIGDFLKDEAKRLMTVVGRAGIGKTATVCRVLKALEHRSLPDDLGPLDVDGIVYLNAIGSRRVNAPNLYEDLLRLLPEGAIRRIEAVVRDPKTATDAKMQALLEAFPEGRMVVLLDNFEDLIDPDTHNITDAELAEVLGALLTLPHHGVKVILTTRVAPRALILMQPGRQVRLDLDGGLESPYAENILREMDADGKLGLSSATDERLALARVRTRGFPRAMEALFAILSADRDTTLEEILAGTSTPLPENVTEALVGEAFSRLDPTQQRVVQALAVYGRPVPPAAVDYLLQPHQPSLDSAPVLGRLVNMHFARKEAGRYYLHPVDREYSLSRIARGEVSDRRAGEPIFTLYGLRHRAADYFEQVRSPRENWKTIEDLAPQLAEFDLRYEGQDYESAGYVLAAISFDFLVPWGWTRRVVEMNERLFGKLDDSRLKSKILFNQGHAYRKLGRVKQAIDYHEQALAIDRNADDRRAEGIDLGNLGACYHGLGQTARAIDYLEQSLAIDREVGNRHQEGFDLGHLGRCYSVLGQTARAIDYLEQALALAREVRNRRDEGINLYSLGARYYEVGQTARALDHFDQSLAIAREVGDRLVEGVILGDLGLCHCDFGQAALAIDYLQQALAIAHEVGDRVDEGYTLFVLSRLYIDEGRHEEAIPQSIDAVRIGGEAGDPWILSHANGTLALARLCVGDSPAARAAAEAARAHDVPMNNHNVLALLGLIALRQGGRVAAAEAFSAAISHADTMLERCDQNYNALDAKGVALAGLAVLEAPNRAAEAIETFRAARAITRAPGIVGRVRRLLDALAPADAAGVLTGIYEAAAGECDAETG